MSLPISYLLSILSGIDNINTNITVVIVIVPQKNDINRASFLLIS